ncbi:MAG: hypothetical protein AB1633_08790 [Elusimicrobiota bacterium]
MKKLVLFVSLVLVSWPAFAAVEFTVGPGFNVFSDTRITGLNTSFGFSFDLDKFTAGYKTEQGNLTVTDAQASASNFRIATQVNAIEVKKEIVKPAGLPVNIGLEVGSVITTALAGTVNPYALSQVAPLLGIFGGVAYEAEGKQVSTSINANIGYRFIDLTDISVAAAPATFTAGGRNFTDLNGINVTVSIGIKF